ncbi:MAG: hypothetical protein KBD65_00840 [Candidatus Moranbacteria bacterium]|nr:hypothetical protein [Candidatus Moranbacteria bacterium]
MSLIISKQGQPAQKLDQAEFEKEDYLQNYIHENPESIPVYEIEADKKLLVVAREFPTESGPIDALAIDKDGDIYIVETKLYKNPDKRTVVAQALDYGASLWKHLNDFNELIHRIEKEIQAKFHLTFEEKVEKFFGIEQDQIQLMLERMNSNIKDGNIKFVILMDSIDERLKDLIIYVNQNSQFDIYAVQLEYYKFQEYEIMIPKLFGVEVKKNIKNSSTSQRRTWNKDEFSQDARTSSTPVVYKRIHAFLEFSYQNADKVMYGTGNSGVLRYVLSTPKGETTPFFIKSNGEVVFNLDWILEQEKLPRDIVKQLKDGLSAIPHVHENGNKVSINLADDVDLEKILNEVRDFTAKVKGLQD